MTDEINAQIQSLARSGIATHLIQNPADVDSVFAVAKAQDLPEVTFAAAFDEGTLAIGCRGDLPEVLADLATPIEVAPDAPEPAATSDASDQSDGPAEVVAAAPTAPDYSAEFAQLRDAIAALDTPAPAPGPTASEIAEAIKDAADPTPAFDTDALVAQLKDALAPAPIDIDALAAQLQSALPSEPDTSQIEQNLAAMADSLAKFATEPTETPDFTGQLDALEAKLGEANPATQLTRMEKLLTALHGQAEAGQPMIQEALESLSSVTQSGGSGPNLDQLDARISSSEEAIRTAILELKADLSSAAPAMAEAPDMSAIEAQIAQVAADVAALADRSQPDQSARDLSGIEAQLSQLSSDVAALAGASEAASAQVDLSALEQRLDTMGERIDALPLLDVTDALNRLETQLGAEVGDTSGADDETTLQDVDAKLAVLLSVDSKMQALAAQIAALGKRTDPSKEDLAQSILTPLQARLDDGFSALEAHLNAPDAEPDPRLDEVLRQLQEVDVEPDPRVGEILTLLQGLSDHQDTGSDMQPMLSEILNRIDALSARPTADLDLTELRENQARFATAQAEVIRRLEAAIEDLTAPTATSEGGDGSADLTSGLTELRDAMMAKLDELTTSQGEDITPVAGTDIEQMLAETRDTLVSRFDELDMRAPSGTDLVALRENQARFATAQAEIVKRLEAAVSDITGIASNPSGDRDGTDLGADLADLRTMILERMDDLKADQDAGETAENTASHLSLADLRSTLIARFDALEARPAASIDMSILRENQARFATIQAEVVRRFEAAASSLEALQTDAAAPDVDLTPVTEAIAAMSSSQAAALDDLRHRLAELASTEKQDADLSEVADRIKDLSDRQATALQSLQEELKRLAAPGGTAVVEPDPRETNVRSSLDSAIDRLDRAIENMSRSAELVRVPAAVGVGGDRGLVAAIERLRNDLLRDRSLPDDGTFPAAETQFPESERFGKVMGSLADRFEQLTEKLQHPASDEVVFRSGANSRANGSDTSNSGGLDAFAGESTISLHDLRARFAEMLAQHLRENTTETTYTNGATHS